MASEKPKSKAFNPDNLQEHEKIDLGVDEKAEPIEAEEVDDAEVSMVTTKQDQAIAVYGRGVISDDAADSLFAALIEDVRRIEGAHVKGESVPYEVMFGSTARVTIEFTQLEARASPMRNQAASKPVNLRISTWLPDRRAWKSALSRLCDAEEALRFIELFAAGYRAGASPKL